MEKYKVSVIVPVYKVEKYLRECVDSIIKQTYANIEIILIDDGSPDSCGSICDSYQLVDPRIIVIHKKNEGLGYARNCGLDAATGDYVTFVDSDDFLEIDMISDLMKKLIANSADTCVGGFKRIKDRHEIVCIEKYEERIYADEQVKGIYLKRILGSIPKKHDAYKMSVWNVIYSMDIIKRNKIYFPSEKALVSEDLVFNYDYCMEARKICITDNIAYNYRVNATSLSRAYDSDKFIKICTLYEEMKKRVICTYINDKEALYRLKTQFLINVRSCIRQECVSSHQRESKEQFNVIYEICNNRNVKEIIKDYPIKMLNIRQFLFMTMIRFKMVRILKFCSKRLGLF